MGLSPQGRDGEETGVTQGFGEAKAGERPLLGCCQQHRPSETGGESRGQRPSLSSRLHTWAHSNVSPTARKVFCVTKNSCEIEPTKKQALPASPSSGEQNAKCKKLAILLERPHMGRSMLSHRHTCWARSQEGQAQATALQQEMGVEGGTVLSRSLEEQKARFQSHPVQRHQKIPKPLQGGLTHRSRGPSHS